MRVYSEAENKADRFRHNFERVRQRLTHFREGTLSVLQTMETAIPITRPAQDDPVALLDLLRRTLERLQAEIALLVKVGPILNAKSPSPT